MRILVVNGSPHKGGFSAAAQVVAMERLASLGIDAESVQLADALIMECAGCFQCLRTGNCGLQDDMDAIIAKMLEADGYVMVSAVRNDDVTACYKRFFERITYRLGFPLLLEDKHTLAVSSVGYMGGKAANRRMLGLQDVFYTHLSAHIHLSVGIPGSPLDSGRRTRLEAAVDRLVRNIQSRKGRGQIQKTSFALSRFFMRRFVFKGREDVYANVIRHWQQKGYMA